MSVDHPREHGAKVSVGLDAVQLAGFDQRTEDRPAYSAAVAPGKEVVLAPERHGADRAFDRIGVELDAAILQEACQPIPSRERVAHRFGELGATGQQRELRLHPKPEVIDERSR
jgi:hypothetical protein